MTYELTQRFFFEAAHTLAREIEGEGSKRIHGHTYFAELTVAGEPDERTSMQRHCENAAHVAEWLSKHPKVEQVFYPGLASHPQHALAKKQMAAGFGGMVSATLKGGEKAALKFLERCRIFTLAESLGGVESLIEHPGRMTHASTADSPFAAPATLVRLSVGIEAADDLIADLDQALAG